MSAYLVEGTRILYLDQNAARRAPISFFDHILMTSQRTAAARAPIRTVPSVTVCVWLCVSAVGLTNAYVCVCQLSPVFCPATVHRATVSTSRLVRRSGPYESLHIVDIVVSAKNPTKQDLRRPTPMIVHRVVSPIEIIRDDSTPTTYLQLIDRNSNSRIANLKLQFVVRVATISK